MSNVMMGNILSLYMITLKGHHAVHPVHPVSVPSISDHRSHQRQYFQLSAGFIKMIYICNALFLHIAYHDDDATLSTHTALNH